MELKPCPFCKDGGKPKHIKVVYHSCESNLIKCMKCEVSTCGYDTEEEAIATWNTRVVDGKTSDGYHTFNELYHHRAVLFSKVVEFAGESAWKSKLHADGTMFDGFFIVGVETPDGQATYHYQIDPYWEMFDCKEVEYAPAGDGHTPQDAIARIERWNARAERTCEGCIDYDEEHIKDICNTCSRNGSDWYSPKSLPVNDFS